VASIITAKKVSCVLEKMGGRGEVRLAKQEGDGGDRQGMGGANVGNGGGSPTWGAKDIEKHKRENGVIPGGDEGKAGKKERRYVRSGKFFGENEWPGN